MFRGINHAPSAQAPQEEGPWEHYWFTEAGGSPTSFGNVQEASFEDTRKLVSTHVENLVEEEPVSKSKTLTAGELVVDLFLE